MDILQDLIQTNKKIIPKGLKLTIENWPILFMGLIYSIIFMILIPIAMGLWVIGGFLVALVQSALISNYLYLIENIIRYGKISIEDFKAGFKVHLWKIYGIMVVIWFVNYGFNLFLRPIANLFIGSISLWLIIQVLAFVLLNCLPEVIYQKHYHIGESFTYSFDFIKENWLEWFVPNLILGLFLYMMLSSGGTWNLLLGRGIFYPSIGGIIIYIVGQGLLSFIMVYRGLLFNTLNGTTRRKRMFMRNMYK